MGGQKTAPGKLLLSLKFAYDFVTISNSYPAHLDHVAVSVLATTFATLLQTVTMHLLVMEEHYNTQVSNLW